MMTNLAYYQDKPEGYFNAIQSDVADLIRGQDNLILDIGCGEGHTGAWLKSIGKAHEVHGIELMPDAAKLAGQRLDSVTVGSIEELDLTQFADAFDCILATEVLEHLIDPWQVLTRLQSVLKPGGYIIASVPNIRHLRLLWSLVVQGEWRYTSHGPLDKTHLRFFTRKSLARLFTESGYKVERIQPVFLARAKVISTLSFNLFEQFVAYRYYCVGSVLRQP